ncbi:MAG: folate family ECF transporter S component [Oscillospiraceae bacterium]|jgi:ECF transporter S component (folate family)|nr:folate family ECF transporter S component [Oscillospiraceae bacterium]
MSKKGLAVTKTIVTLSLLAAMSIVLSRILAVNVGPYRFSIGSMPLLLAGLLFGPVGGALCGFAADFLGAFFLGNGPYSPMLAPTPILMGLLPGLLRHFVWEKPGSVSRYILALLPSYIVGSMGYSTFILSKYIYGQPFLPLFMQRVVIYAVTFVVDAAIVFLLVRSGIFHNTGIIERSDARK